MPVSLEIRTPRGIRFECSGCANCCLQWPVPLTEKDWERINKISVSNAQRAEMRSLSSSRQNLISFTHTLEKQPSGACTYLNESKQCLLRLEHGAESKPAMCRLFPYSFMVTPDAVLASLSFASSAVLFNTGELLSRQAEVLSRQYEIFQSLFQPRVELWNELRITDRFSLSWEKFRKLDGIMSEIIEDSENAEDETQHPRDLAKKFKRATSEILKHLPDPSACDLEPKMEARPKIVDQIILKYLERLYFPADVFGERDYDFRARDLITEIVQAPNAVSFGQAGRQRKFADLIEIKLGNLAPDIAALFDRYLYVRFFSKMYFGPGFHHLSLLVGINHLRLIHTLLRLKLKQHLLFNPDSPAKFEDAAELLRILERRLTQLDLGKESHTLFEVLLLSPARQERMEFLGA